jgi:preprotein translocase subunit SecD
MIGLLIFALVVDGAGYIYRAVNHYPMTGSVPGLPPNLAGWQLYIHRGLDLSGGTYLQYQMTDFPPGQDRASVMQREIDIIQHRVNTLGVSEPVVRSVGNNNDRIEVQLAGVSAQQANAVIGKPAQLVITKWVPDSTITNGPWPGYRPQKTAMTADMLSSASAGLNQSGGAGWVVNFQFNSEGANIFAKLSTDAYNAAQAANNSQSGATDIATGHITNWLDLGQDDMDHWNDRANDLYKPYDQGGKLLSDPVIQSPITGGQGYIQGSFSADSAKNLATLLNSGALPAGLVQLSVSEVGASLGQQAIALSLTAGLLGLTVVVIFMMALYRLPGVLASIALLCYAAAVLAVWKALPVTVTLGGMAGFILSVGMAVDANVLIFERLKEEMRAGRTVAGAVDAAVRRAWPAIRDSNTATAITCLVLIFSNIGGSVLGFALTLLIGVVISMISSIVITHNLLAIVLKSHWARSPNILGVTGVPTRGRA